MLIFRISRTHFVKIKKNLGRKFLEFVWAVFVNIDYLNRYIYVLKLDGRKPARCFLRHSTKAYWIISVIVEYSVLLLKHLPKQCVLAL